MDNFESIRRLVAEANAMSRIATDLAASAGVAQVLAAVQAAAPPKLPDFGPLIEERLDHASRLAEIAQSLYEPVDRLRPLVEAAYRSVDVEAVMASAQAAARLQADLGAQYVEIWERWRKRMEELTPDKRRVVRYLGQRAWYQSFAMPWWDEELRQLVDADDAVGVDAHMASLVESSLDEIVADAGDKFPNRVAVIEQAKAAFDRGDYELAILGTLSQADGITFEILGVSAFGKRDGRPATAPHAESRRAARHASDLEWSLIDLDPLIYGSTLMMNTADRDAARAADPNFGPLNRHGVLHGLDVGYGSRENALRAFAALGYFLSLRDLLDLQPATSRISNP